MHHAASRWKCEQSGDEFIITYYNYPHEEVSKVMFTTFIDENDVPLGVRTCRDLCMLRSCIQAFTHAHACILRPGERQTD